MGTFLKYIGRYDKQEYLKKDFAANGVEDQGAVSWQSGDVREVSNDAADFLMQIHGTEFEEVADERGRSLDAEDPDHEDTGNFNGQDVADTPPGNTANVDDQDRVGSVETAVSKDAAPQTSGVAETSTTSGAQTAKGGKGSRAGTSGTRSSRK